MVCRLKPKFYSTNMTLGRGQCHIYLIPLYGSYVLTGGVHMQHNDCLSYVDYKKSQNTDITLGSKVRTNILQICLTLRKADASFIFIKDI